ncbi:MAG: inositol 2-dehydrogenase [Geminicoccaceae bacterium]
MVRFALMGAGRIGAMHARNIQASHRATLTRVFDVAEPAANTVADQTGATAVTRVEEALGEDVDAVLIASSTDTHVDLLTAATKAGKAVLCEKPIDLDMARVDACWSEIGPLNPIVQLGFNRRFDPSFRSLRERLQRGLIGRPEQLIIISRDPGPPPKGYLEVSGGLFRDMTIHDFDLARFFLGEFDEVYATGAALFDQNAKALDDIDSAMIVLRARSGALCHINNSRRAVYGYDQRIEIHGTEGMIQAGNWRATSVEIFGADTTAAKDPLLDFFIERYAQAYVDELDHFIDCVTGRTPPSVGFEDGRRALALADAAFTSLREGRPVTLDG